MWNKRADMIVHEEQPYNAEPPRTALASDITPLDTFYVRNHGPVPTNAPDQFRLTIDGLVDQNTEWGLDQLREQFPTHELPVTLQCAGNRRAGYLDVRDIPGEDPWGPAATSTATWTGLRLGDLLRAVGPTHDAEHVLFGAPDVSDLATPPQRFGGSIPLTKALSGEVLLAWGMNGQPLPATHGAPLRVVVPGYIGARSVKWLDRITLAAQASDNYFQATAYRLLPAEADPTTAGHGDGISLGPIALNSEILSPDDGATVPAGTTHVTGYALAGEDRGVARVDVSLDNGQTWIQAELDPPLSRWTWRLWHAELDLPPGQTTLTARAWDTTAATQPESAAALWNPKGYVNNAWAHITVTAT